MRILYQICTYFFRVRTCVPVYRFLRRNQRARRMPMGDFYPSCLVRERTHSPPPHSYRCVIFANGAIDNRDGSFVRPCPTPPSKDIKTGKPCTAGCRPGKPERLRVYLRRGNNNNNNMFHFPSFRVRESAT